MKEIIIDVTEDGEVKLETKGFSGKTCVTESRFLKELLGSETFRQLTPAYYQQKQHECMTVKKYLPLCG